MAKSAGKPGRPKKPEGEKLEQFSIRLPPKLKLGLELLSRVQSRSLSQCLEWSLLQALMSAHVPGDPQARALLEVADVAQRKAAGFFRAHYLYQVNPVLVPFDERHAIELVLNSKEWKHLNADLASHPINVLQAWNDLLDWAWPVLVKDAEGLTIANKQRASDRNPLCLDIGLLLASHRNRKQPIEKLILEASAAAKEDAANRTHD
jgi:hypothetical protein